MKIGIALLVLTLVSAVRLQAELRVASLSTITTEIAESVGGPAARVVPIIRAGIDPHDFQPSPQDVREIESADLVLLTGKGMEGYLTKLEEAVGNRAKFVDVSEAIPS